MISSALIPLDGSPSAEQAIPYGQALLPDGGEVMLFQAIPEPDPLLTSLAWAFEETLDADKAKAVCEALEHVKERVADRRLRWTARVTHGDPADQILQAIPDNAIELVVMTTHGRGAVGRSMFGSVADRVARESPVPVVLVRPWLATDASPTVEFKRLVVPLDGSILAEASLPVAIELAKRLHVPVQLVRAIDVTALLSPLSEVIVADVYQETVSAIENDCQVYLEEIAARLRAQGVSVQYTVLTGSPYFSISAACNAGDLIIITSHGRSGALRWFLGSVAEKLVREAPAPVLLVPSAGRGARLGTV